MVVLQTFIKTTAVSGIAFFWVNVTVESLKIAWHIISSEDETTLIPPSRYDAFIKTMCRNCQEHKAVCRNCQEHKAVCGNCQEHYDDDEYHLIHGTHLCEACR